MILPWSRAADLLQRAASMTTRELEECSVDELKARVLAGDLASATLRVLADRQDRANDDLMYACRNGDADAVRRLLAEGADVGQVHGGKKEQFTPLTWACAYKWLDRGTHSTRSRQRRGAQNC